MEREIYRSIENTQKKIELGVSEGEKEEGGEEFRKEISTVGSHLLATVGSKNTSLSFFGITPLIQSTNQLPLF